VSKSLPSSRKRWHGVPIAAAAILLSACGSTDPADPTQRTTLTGGTAQSEARFTLRTINGVPTGSNQAAALCSFVSGGMLVFSEWDSRAEGTVVARHELRGTGADSLQPLREVQWSGRYAKIDGRVLLRVGTDVVYVLTLDANSQRLSTNDAGCYVGQPVIVDLPTELAYERQSR
jgi:hypothetical protein